MDSTLHGRHPGPIILNTRQGTTAYNWWPRNKDRNYVIGIGVDWPVMERLRLKGSVLCYHTDGSADISSQNGFGNCPTVIDHASPAVQLLAWSVIMLFPE